MAPKSKKALNELRGIFKPPGSKYRWLRYSSEGKQIRISLETEDLVEAIQRAKIERSRGYYDRKQAGQKWTDAVEKYIGDKLAGTSNCRKFRPKTARNTRLDLLHFAVLSKITDPTQVTLKHLQAYYEHYQKPGPMVVVKRRNPKTYKRQFKIPRVVKAPAAVPMRQGSEASARTYLARVESFLAHIGCLPGRVKIQAGTKVAKRTKTIAMAEAIELASGCERVDLKFVLICGFTMGMRRSEIIAVRPDWFKEGRLEIPGEEIQMLEDKTKRIWKTKNGDGRAIPLPPPMREFQKNHPDLFDKKRLFILHPEACGKGYRWDPRRPFADYMKENGFPGFSMHAMRHSFISHLAHSQEYSVGQVSAWSGDKLQTIQKNYFHARAPDGGLDAAFNSPEEKEKAAARKYGKPYSLMEISALLTKGQSGVDELQKNQGRLTKEAYAIVLERITQFEIDRQIERERIYRKKRKKKPV